MSTLELRDGCSMVLGETVAKYVKALRLERGLSQKELGEKTEGGVKNLV